MAVHDAGPLGQPLEEVVANDHRELGSLVVELARTPTTPGVARDLTETLDRTARVHLAVCERLLFPILDAGGREGLADQVAVANRSLLDQLDQLDQLGGATEERAAALAAFEAELADHVAFEEEVVVPAAVTCAGRDAADLGSRFSDLADTAPIVGLPRSGVGGDGDGDA